MTPDSKIIEIEKLAEKLKPLRAENKKIVLSNGCFDLLHIGHIRHFNKAKMNGDILVVTITPDLYVDKGPNRPAFSEVLRAEAVASLNNVDYVAISKWPTAEGALRLLKPDCYAKGSESKEKKSDNLSIIDRERLIAEEIGSKIIFTEDIVFSSSNLINRFLSNMTTETHEYIKLLKNRYSTDDILKTLAQINSTKVLVIGDTILDDYHYCETIGKSSKDPTLAMLHKSSELFAGGVLAVANHVANFTKSVELFTVLGEKNSYEDFIRTKLHNNIKTYFQFKRGAPTLIKRRFLDGYSFNKLLEVYIMDDSELPDEQDAELCEWIKKELSKYNLVIAADFGHGTISNKMRKVLSNHSSFLAVNTQANAGNRGFHTISSYLRADLVCLAEHEMRLEKRKMNGPLRPMMTELSEQLDCRTFIVTRGRRGCLVNGKNDEFISVPSLTSKVVDRVGAGDAFFSIAALTASQNADNEIIGFLGNVVGSLAVEIIGNQKPIDKLALEKYVASILK
jgi:cytidyltransferase-like protein